MTRRTSRVAFAFSLIGARQAPRRRVRYSAGGARPWESLSAKEAFTFSKDLADRTGGMAKSRSLSWRLGVSTLLIVLPLALFALIMVGWIAHTEREEEKNQLIGEAYAFADAVGREIHS